MDSDERDIVNFLKAFPGEYVAIREICRRASGKWRFRDEPEWAGPVLVRLVERGIIEDDANGHFRFIIKDQKENAKWVAPHIRAILKKSGKFKMDDPEDPH
jgi:hypothetical protein